jgi:DNA-binding response OmpR family regulator
MPGAAAPRRILVADDEPTIRRLFKESLTFAGYRVELSENGREALNLYRTGAYDLLILDVALSKKTGLEVVVKLRNSGDPVPIILTAGGEAGEGRVEPFAFTYRVELLRKPFGLRDLRAAVERATGRPDP